MYIYIYIGFVLNKICLLFPSNNNNYKLSLSLLKIIFQPFLFTLNTSTHLFNPQKIKDLPKSILKKILFVYNFYFIFF